MSEQTLLDLDSELEDSVDNTEAAPDFVEPPAGKYRIAVVSAKMKQKDGTDKDTGEEVTKTSVNIVYKVVETVEVAADAGQVPNGSLFSERFQWTEEGKSYLKARCQKILGAEAMQGAKWKDILEGLADAPDFPATITWTETKVKDKIYRNLRMNITKEEA